MQRLIEHALKEWKEREQHKPLLLRGARQVGKTWSLRRLGESFTNCVECNFEQDISLAKLFDGDLSAKTMRERISAYTAKPIEPGKTLLFLDEIQACPNALRSLRFLYEQLPELHVAAAGSLLEFALEELPSFGVGRIESLYMWPMNFREFLMVRNEAAMLDGMMHEKDRAPVSFHEKLIDSLRIYMMLGGMPEVISSYEQNRDINQCMRVLDTLYAGLQDDFAKYRSRVPAGRIREVFESVVMQAGGKFVYNNVASGLDARQVKAALSLLIQAGLAHGVTHSAAQGIPLGAQARPSRYKVIPADLGLYHRILNVPASLFLTDDKKDLVNKGASAEIMAGLELLKAAPMHRKSELFYWQKEKRAGNAEVDYVIQKGMDVVPIEVKAGTRGAMQSMRVFLESHSTSTYGVRSSLESFGSIGNDIRIVPLYALGEWAAMDSDW
ncbi:MAG: DUF4143 domain-containing protein [Spartobacteria bacterium]|nr:DUF4143 domain-containing protein [Spartobacteria bacterium]